MKLASTTATTTPAKDKYVGSSADKEMSGAILVHAPPKVGKTFFSGTGSKFWPKELPSKTHVNLADMLWVSFDAGAVDGFKEMNISVDEVDGAAVLSDYGVDKGLPKLMDIIEENTKGRRFVVSDTVSMLDTILVDYYESRAPEGNTWWAYKKILEANRRYYTRLISTGVRNIFLFHSRVVNEALPNAAKKKAAQQTSGMGDIIPDISGQGRKVYVGNASLEGVILCKKVPGSSKLTRTFHGYPVAGFEAGNRFNLNLAEVEPADLSYILEKVSRPAGSVKEEPRNE